jgi:hypothetical protein
VTSEDCLRRKTDVKCLPIVVARRRADDFCGKGDFYAQGAFWLKVRGAFGGRALTPTGRELIWPTHLAHPSGIGAGACGEARAAVMLADGSACCSLLAIIGFDELVIIAR